jgi:hypothetical protein
MPIFPERVVNDAVARCCDAFNRAAVDMHTEGKSGLACIQMASKAYRNVMPNLDRLENVADFIACAAHGIATEVIDGKIGSQLLYAAQVATAALRRQKKSSGRRKTST